MAEQQKKALPPGKEAGDKKSKGKEKAPKKQRVGTQPWMELVGFTACVLMVVGIAVMISSSMSGPPMPTTLVMASGIEAGSTTDVAKKYSAVLQEYGVTVELQPTTSSLESLQKLEAKEGSKDAKIQLAMVWGGAVTQAQDPKARSIASLYLEPLWVFHRGTSPFTRLTDLQGLRVAIGAEGSECNAITRELFADNGLMYSAQNAARTTTAVSTTILPLEGSDALVALRNGDLDAMVMLAPAESPLVNVLLKEPGLQVMEFTQQAAFERRYTFLAGVVLPRGTIDLGADLPSRDLRLVAPAVGLVGRPDLHPALINLLLKAARQINGRGDLISAPGVFPSSRYLDLPLNEVAENYFKDGTPVLYRYLPFATAVSVEARKALIFTVFLMIWPVFWGLPWLLRWRLRTRLFQWYRVVRSIETLVASEQDPKNLQKELQALETVEQQVMSEWVPLGSMGDFYNLRMHISFVQKKIELRIQGGGERR